MFRDGTGWDGSGGRGGTCACSNLDFAGPRSHQTEQIGEPTFSDGVLRVRRGSGGGGGILSQFKPLEAAGSVDGSVEVSRDALTISQTRYNRRGIPREVFTVTGASKTTKQE